MVTSILETEWSKSRLGVAVRLAGIRLLLVFVTTNTIMILMLVPSMTSQHPWLASVLPGEFTPGSNYSGYWVFFALVLLVDAITVIAVAMAVLIPGVREMVVADPNLVATRLAGRDGISEQARSAVLDEMHEELAGARYQLFVGRVLMGVGAFFLVLAFSSVTLSFARAIPSGSMFIQECTSEVPVCGTPLMNAAVGRSQIQRFTLDQITRGVLFGAPDVYGWRIAEVGGNPRNVMFSHFVFAFRVLLGLIFVLTLVSLRVPSTLTAAEPEPAPKDQSLSETPQLRA